MKKIITVMLTFLFLTSCGYTPIYFNKNFDFNIKDITISKNDQLSYKTKKMLLALSNQNSQRIIYLDLDVQKKTNVITKNSKGDPSRYEMVINIQLDITYNKDQKIRSSFKENFNYNENINKFELSQYTKEIEDLLINQNIDRIIIYLSKI
tara:strand:+ start:52 stop:504 length:453 start_codon:yes stop_codon:yes gene_type:complete